MICRMSATHEHNTMRNKKNARKAHTEEKVDEVQVEFDCGHEGLIVSVCAAHATTLNTHNKQGLLDDARSVVENEAAEQQRADQRIQQRKLRHANKRSAHTRQR